MNVGPVLVELAAQLDVVTPYAIAALAGLAAIAVRAALEALG